VPKLQEIFYTYCGRGSVLLWRQCYIIIYFGFCADWRHIFS